uniref:Putative cytochrome p450 6a14-like protein n=1 Tax=Panstrongylus megistus TaxID=65343 RepID=A0A069DUV8_9HEMI
MLTSILLAALFVIIYTFLTINHDYWQKKGIPYRKPYPFFGNLFRVFIKKETYQMALHRFYKESEGHRFFGIFNLMIPTLLIRDVKTINHVLKTDFSRFSSRGLMVDYKRDPLSVNIFFMDGHLWKRSRELLRPGFKAGRLRSLVPLIEKSAKLVFEEGGEQRKCLEVKEFSKRFSAAVIVGPVLGLELSDAIVDAFVKHMESAFNVQGWQAIAVFLRLFVPKIALALGIKCVPQETEDFFKDVVEKVKAGREDGVIREDYIETIISSINGLSDHYEKSLLDAAMSGQFFIFALGGFETTTSTLIYSLHELARHQDVCEEARLEISRVLGGRRGGFTYDHLKEMVYLENVINEVLRLHPPITGYTRVCTATYRIPDSDIVLQPGDPVIIPVLSVQTDSKYFDQPEEFRPSRFDKPIVEGTFLPFALGPRNCLGMRLAMMQLKIVLAHILLNFDISLDITRTPEKLEFHPEYLIAAPLTDVWINFTPR